MSPVEPDKSSYEIVGVVEDGKYESLTEDATAAMFFPLPQNKDGYTTLVVRSQLPPEQVTPALNRILTGIDSSLPFTIEPWQDTLALVLFPARVATAALGAMGMLAAMLAITGIFGMSASNVSKRMGSWGFAWRSEPTEGRSWARRWGAARRVGGWFGSRLDVRRAGEPVACIPGVSGHAARSAGAAGRVRSDGADWAGGRHGFRRGGLWE